MNKKNCDNIIKMYLKGESISDIMFENSCCRQLVYNCTVDYREKKETKECCYVCGRVYPSPNYPDMKFAKRKHGIICETCL